MKIYAFDTTKSVYLIEPPFSTEADRKIIHLGNYDGKTYVSITDDTILSAELGATALDAQTIKTVAPHLDAYADINAQVVAKIRSQYSLEDELGALRQNDTTYQTFVSAAIADGKAKKTALGF